jgi:hypothetical protein
MAKNTDWGGIKRDYLSRLLSIREIAKKYGVNDKTIRLRRDADKWDDERAEIPQVVRSAENADVVENTNVRPSKPAENSAAEAQESALVLKPQWELFAQNVAEGMPLKDAAICAGYSPTRADAQSSDLWRRPAIRARVKELRQETAQLVSFNARHLAEISYNTAKEARTAGKYGQVAPNIKNAALLTGIDVAGKSDLNVDLAGLSYGKVCIVTPANCPADVWASHMEKLREGKSIAQS